MASETAPGALQGVPVSDDTRAASDRMLVMVDELRRLETEKRQHPIGTAEFVRLAGEAETLSRMIFRWSQMQGALAEESGEQGPGVAIADVTPRPIHMLLANWREAELRLLAARPGSAEAEAATSEIERLREEYRQLADEQRRRPG